MCTGNYAFLLSFVKFWFRRCAELKRNPSLSLSLSFTILFIYSWETQREAKTQAEGATGFLHGAPGLDPGSWDQALGREGRGSTAQPPKRPINPYFWGCNNKHYKVMNYQINNTLLSTWQRERRLPWSEISQRRWDFPKDRKTNRLAIERKQAPWNSCKYGIQ